MKPFLYWTWTKVTYFLGANSILEVTFFIPFHAIKNKKFHGYYDILYYQQLMFLNISLTNFEIIWLLIDNVCNSNMSKENFFYRFIRKLRTYSTKRKLNFRQYELHLDFNAHIITRPDEKFQNLIEYHTSLFVVAYPSPLFTQLLVTVRIYPLTT